MSFFNDLFSGIGDAFGSIATDVRKIFGGATQEERMAYAETGKILDSYQTNKPWYAAPSEAIGGSLDNNILVIAAFGLLALFIFSD